METRALLATGDLETGLRDPSPAVRSASARALGEIADVSSLPALLAALHDPAAGIAAEAAAALARLGNPSAVPDLIAALDFPARTETERQAIIRALGTLGGEPAQSALFRLFQTETDSETAAALALALGELHAESAVPALLNRLQMNPGPALQMALIQALGEIGAFEAVPVLLAELEAANSAQVPALADALARLNVLAALPALLRRLDELDSVVARKQTAAAMGALLNEGETDVPPAGAGGHGAGKQRRRNSCRRCRSECGARPLRRKWKSGATIFCAAMARPACAACPPCSPCSPKCRRPRPKRLPPFAANFLLQAAPLESLSPETLLLVLTALRSMILNEG